MQRSTRATEPNCYLIARESFIKILTTSIEFRDARLNYKAEEAFSWRGARSGLILLRKITLVYPNVVKTTISEVAEIISWTNGRPFVCYSGKQCANRERTRPAGGASYSC